ncbi:MAG TPA: sulfite exporter TauE/SafE family protein [Thiotrichales bacterium]|nr:sulfite exporter TauE/SafE family protein [Thiotrichales bacterium]
MCGGIQGALTLSLPEEVRRRGPRLVMFLAAYNLARITSYALAGALIAGLGSGLSAAAGLTHGHTLIRVLSAALLVGIGLHLAGWFPAFAQVERLGVPLWRQLEPLGRRLLPVRTLGRALVFGLVWGWLPCGLVYTALLWTATAGDAGLGALYMASFGLGTLPAAFTTGLLTGGLSRLMADPRLRRGVGLMLILFGLASLAFQPPPAQHSSDETLINNPTNRQDAKNAKSSYCPWRFSWRPWRLGGWRDRSGLP